MENEDEDDSCEHLLFICREVKLYQIPPRSGNRGYRAGEWAPPAAKELPACRLRIISRGKSTKILLEDATTGALFAETPVKDPLEKYVEPVTDSSRYFVLRVEDGVSGKHAFLGIGFTERSQSFDFNVALQDHSKRQNRTETKIDWGPMKDLSLKDGEKIKV